MIQPITNYFPTHHNRLFRETDNRTGSRRWNTGPYEILAVGTYDIRELCIKLTVFVLILFTYLTESLI
jgi:hypothetical protein